MLSLLLFFSCLLLRVHGLGLCNPANNGEEPQFFGAVLSCVLPATDICPDINDININQTFSVDLTTEAPGSGPIPIGFEFGFFGTNYSQLTIGRTGVLSFAQPVTDIPTSCVLNDTINDALYAVHSNFNTTAPGAQVLYATIGNEPNRQFLLSFVDVPFVGDTFPNRWSIVLNEDRSFSTCVTAIGPSPPNSVALNGIHVGINNTNLFSECIVENRTYHYDVDFQSFATLPAEPLFFDAECFSSCRERESPCVFSQYASEQFRELNAETTQIRLFDNNTAGSITENRFLAIFDINGANITLRGRLLRDGAINFLPFAERYSFIVADNEIVLGDLNQTRISDQTGDFANFSPENQLPISEAGISAFTFSTRYQLIYAADNSLGNQLNFVSIANLPLLNPVGESIVIGSSIDLELNPSQTVLVQVPDLGSTNSLNVFRLSPETGLPEMPPASSFSISRFTTPRDLEVLEDRILVLHVSTLVMWDLLCLLDGRPEDDCLFSVVEVPTDCRSLSLFSSDNARQTPNRAVISCSSGWDVYDFSEDEFRLVSSYREDGFESRNPIGVPLQLQDFVVVDGLIYAAVLRNGVAGFCPGTSITRNVPSDSLSSGEIAGAVLGSIFGCCCLSLLLGTCLFFVVKSKVSAQRERFHEDENYEIPTVHISKHGTKENILTGVTQSQMIGKGAFGKVYQGSWEQTDVALKGIEGEDLELEYSVLTSLSHPYIIRCYGVCKLRDEMFLVLELMKGDLLTELQSNSDLPGKELPSMVYQTALGMKYLHAQNILHRDLACRNLLFIKSEESYLIKVSDFGLSRQTNYYKATTKGRIPYKWSAPEAIKFQKFSNASDIWAYGIVIWEIFSRGAVPYPTTENEDLLDKLENGYRLTFPNNTPSEWSTIAQLCWSADPKERPSFSQIIQKLPKSPIPHRLTVSLSQKFKIETSHSDLHDSVSHYH